MALPYKPRIFRYGLALVLIPLSLGTIALVMMDRVWLSAENVALEESKQSNVVQHLNHAFEYWETLGTSLVGCTLNEENPILDQQINSTVSKLHEEFSQLRKQTQDQPTKFDTVVRLESLFLQETGTLARVPTNSALVSTASDLLLLQEMPAMASKAFRVRSVVRRILTQEWQILQAARRHEDRSREILRIIAFGVAIADIAFALFLAWIFSKSITDRLQTLMSNASQLPRNEPLNQLISGNDEFAYLDRIICQAAEKLDEASKHRRSIIDMVGHDMRSPLMAAQVCIRMIQEYESGPRKLTDESFKVLDNGYKCLSSTLQQSEDILVTQNATIDELDERKDNSGQREPLSAGTVFIPLLKGILNSICHPRIFQKGLIPVLAPLLIQLVFLVFICQQMSIAEEIARQERLYSDINNYSNFVSLDMVRASTAQFLYLLSGALAAHKQAQNIYEHVREQYSKFEALSASDAEWSVVIKESKAVRLGQLAQLLSLQPADSFDKKIEVMNRADHARVGDRKHAAALYAKDSFRLQQMELEQSAISKRVSSIFGWSIFASLLVGIALLTGFSRDITRRLNLLIGNAGKLGLREPLEQAVPGTDELAYLDLILHDAENQLEQASKQRTMLMSSLAQEFRESLHAAQDFFMLFDELNETTIQAFSRKQLQRALKNIERILELIDDLLGLETLAIGKVTLETVSCDILQVTDEAIAAVKSLATQKNINLINECCTTVVQADKDRLAQVLVNYLSNAVKFSTQDTSVTLKCEELPHCIRVSVIDQGPGIDKQTKELVFEKFFQAATPQKKQGFGLGLAISRLIVESHGGRVGVESEIGVGSSFWLEIPKIAMRANDFSK